MYGRFGNAMLERRLSANYIRYCHVGIHCTEPGFGRENMTNVIFYVPGAVMTAAAEEVVGTILFEPKPYSSGGGWTYSLSTNPDSKIADIVMEINYGSVGYALDYLPDYLVKGAR
jgi:hypothetical protein